jgi:beta-fructofuranosidase
MKQLAVVDRRQTDLSDPHRPRFHFLPAKNWMNDPNGLIQWKGQYHLFYQYNPNSALHETIHWGHAVSTDLVRWTDLPIALAPTAGGPDAEGCWSGCAVNDHGIPTLIYTGIRPQAQCLATSRDGLITWDKFSANPVLKSPPQDLNVVGAPWDFRDPWVWQEDGLWYMLVGSGITDIGGTLFLYKSDNLIHWDYLQPIWTANLTGNDEVWECPGLFRLNDQHVVLLSVQPEFRHTYYSVGKYADHRFVPDTVGKTDFGPYFYAAQTMLDDQGRRLMWGWIKEGRPVEARQAAGWAGVMSLPRVMSLGAGGRLQMEPPTEIQSIRSAHHRVTNVGVLAETTRMLDGLEGDSLEIIADLEPGDAQQVGLKVRCSPGGEEETLIYYDGKRQCLVIDARRASLDPSTDRSVEQGDFRIESGETLQLRIFIDRSVLEVFANGRVCITSRIYPSRSDSLGLCLFATGGSAWFKSIDIWEMNSIWGA